MHPLLAESSLYQSLGPMPKLDTVFDTMRIEVGVQFFVFVTELFK